MNASYALARWGHTNGGKSLHGCLQLAARTGPPLSAARPMICLFYSTETLELHRHRGRAQGAGLLIPITASSFDGEIVAQGNTGLRQSRATRMHVGGDGASGSPVVGWRGSIDRDGANLISLDYYDQAAPGWPWGSCLRLPAASKPFPFSCRLSKGPAAISVNPQGVPPRLRSGDACGSAPSSGAIGNGPEQPKEQVTWPPRSQP